MTLENLAASQPIDNSCMEIKCLHGATLCWLECKMQPNSPGRRSSPPLEAWDKQNARRNGDSIHVYPRNVKATCHLTYEYMCNCTPSSPPAVPIQNLPVSPLAWSTFLKSQWKNWFTNPYTPLWLMNSRWDKSFYMNSLFGGHRTSFELLNHGCFHSPYQSQPRATRFPHLQ